MNTLELTARFLAREYYRGCHGQQAPESASSKMMVEHEVDQQWRNWLPRAEEFLNRMHELEPEPDRHA